MSDQEPDDDDLGPAYFVSISPDGEEPLRLRPIRYADAKKVCEPFAYIEAVDGARNIQNWAHLYEIQRRTFAIPDKKTMESDMVALGRAVRSFRANALDSQSTAARSFRRELEETVRQGGVNIDPDADIFWLHHFSKKMQQALDIVESRHDGLMQNFGGLKAGLQDGTANQGLKICIEKISQFWAKLPARAGNYGAYIHARTGRAGNDATQFTLSVMKLIDPELTDSLILKYMKRFKREAAGR